VLMLVTVGVVVAGGNVSGGSETDIFAFCAFSGLTKVLLSKEFLVLGVIIIGCATSTLYTASSVNFCHKIDTIPAKSGISNYMRRDLTLSLSLLYSSLFLAFSCLTPLDIYRCCSRWLSTVLLTVNLLLIPELDSKGLLSI
jgi:hypothetical protein